MERLTVYDEYAHIGRGGIAHKQCREKCTTGMTCATCSLEEDMLKRLAAYEDLGPVEEFAAMKERTRWIPVSERLPKINGAYQVFRPTFHNPMCFSICYFDGQNTWHDSYGVDFTRVLSSGDVTHWMPLPSAPDSEAANGN